MEPIYKFPGSPGTPLFPVSPERANRKNPPYALHQASSPQQHNNAHRESSPSRLHETPPPSPTFHHLVSQSSQLHMRGTSDVQGKVAQFNGLAKEAAQRRRENEAALKRAVLGREEAEGESRRLRDENERLRREAEEWRAKERRSSEKMVVLQDDLQRVKDTHTHAQSIYEKEVRRARKEAFKSSSSLVQLQEELKCARNRYTLMREERDTETRAKEAKEQEAFQARYKMASLQDEVEGVKKQLGIRETERNALKMTLKEEEVAKVAAEGAIALPAPQEDDWEFSTPQRPAETAPILEQRRESAKENVDPLSLEITTTNEELTTLKDELRLEKRLRARAEEDVHFLKMECQFGICSCRMAQMQGAQFVHDQSFNMAWSPSPNASPLIPHEEHIPAPRAAKQEIADLPIDPAIASSPLSGQPAQVLPVPAPAPAPLLRSTSSSSSASSAEQVLFSPHSGTFAKPHPHQRGQLAGIFERIDEVPTLNNITTVPIMDPSTPKKSMKELQAPRTISTSTTLSQNDSEYDPGVFASGGISREAALEQIRLRRGRARSAAEKSGSVSPAKNSNKAHATISGGRREISAPLR